MYGNSLHDWFTNIVSCGQIEENSLIRNDTRFWKDPIDTGEWDKSVPMTYTVQ